MESPTLAAFISERDAAPVDEPPPVEAPPETPAADPAGDGVVARVRAKLAAKAQPSPAAAPPVVPPPAAPAPATTEPTYTVAQLREQLESPAALDRLFELGIDVVKLHERMVARANTPREVRAVNDAVAKLDAKFDERLARIEAAQQQQLTSEEQADFNAALANLTSFVGSKAADFPFLTVESVDEQRARVVRAAAELVESGEATGTDADIEAIAQLAEDAARKHASRYPGVRLGAGTEPAVGAGSKSPASPGPATLSGSLGGETTGQPGVPPPFGTPEWRKHMMHVASRMGL